jgi:class 3 adenylate cyclase
VWEHFGPARFSQDDALTCPQLFRNLERAAPILVSEKVQLLCRGSDFTFEDAGEHELKGVPERWHLYRVVA